MAQVLYQSRGIRTSTCVIMIILIVVPLAMAVLSVAVSLSRWNVYVTTGETYLTTFADGTQGYVDRGEIRNIARFDAQTRLLFWACAAVLLVIAVLLCVRLYHAKHSSLTVYADRIEIKVDGSKWFPSRRHQRFSLFLVDVATIRVTRGLIPGVLIMRYSGKSIRSDCRNPQDACDVVLRLLEH